MNVVVHGREERLRAELAAAVKSLGYEPIEAGGMDELRTRAELARIVLVDVAEHGAPALVEEIRSRLPGAGIVAVSDASGPGAALRALQDGAHAFLRKPFRIETLEAALAEAGARAGDGEADVGFVARAAATRRTRDVLARVSRGDATVLIEGDAGTGKSHAARWLHSIGRRRHAPFVALDCRALGEADPEGDGEDPRGLLTRIAAAQGGTCLLEDVDALEPALQPRLVEILHHRGAADRPGALDVRFVATTREDLRARTADGRFSRELLYQLDVVRVALDPLRERAADIRPLAELFLDRIAGAEGRPRPRLDGDALHALAELPLPGNARELEMLMRRAVLLTPGETLDVRALAGIRPGRDEGPTRPTETFDLRTLERDTIARALRAAEGNRTAAARALGISVRTLRNKIHRYAL